MEHFFPGTAVQARLAAIEANASIDDAVKELLRSKYQQAIAALEGEAELPAPVQTGGDPDVAPEAERRQLTILFCDLVGSTAQSVELHLDPYLGRRNGLPVATRPRPELRRHAPLEDRELELERLSARHVLEDGHLEVGVVRLQGRAGGDGIGRLFR